MITHATSNALPPSGPTRPKRWRRDELLHRIVAASLRRDGFTVTRPSPIEPRLLLVTKEPAGTRHSDQSNIAAEVLTVMCIRHRRLLGHARHVLATHAPVLGAVPVVAMPRTQLFPPARRVELVELTGPELELQRPLAVDRARLDLHPCIHQAVEL